MFGLAPLVSAAIIGGGASLIGGMMSNRATRQANEANMDMQYDFARNGISWKVADAKRAGLHPLAALGASTAQAAPSFVAGDLGESVSRAGQQVGDLVARTASPEYKLVDLQAKAIQAATEKDFAQAQYWRSEAARSANQAVSGGSIPGVNIQPITASHVIGKDLDVVPPGLVQGKAHEVVSARPGLPHTAAGRNPGWGESVIDVLPDGRKLIISTPMNEEGWSEGKESAGLEDYPLIVRKSAAASGMTPKQWIWSYLTGAAPLPPRPHVDKTPRPKPPVPMYRGGSRSVYGPVD